ncbi:toll-like receptor 4 [Plakobranchus ocellatus]|uniref:Toll-like receptor 4 n=1 Tax=Plakobranchus ocellatus TaxID=259542 RepID=A0AAV4C5I9_9GAST|nr:toll-like receptor 4 [Plakobranchus ocellatus]
MKIRRQTLFWTMRLFSTIIILTTQFESSQTFHPLSISKEGTLRKRASYGSETTNSEFAQEKSKVLTAHMKAWYSFHNASPAMEQGSVSSLKTYECPPTCHCSHGKTSTEAIIVDCSSRDLTRIPKLPPHATQVYLQGNSISSVPCRSFERLKFLEILDLSRNTLDSLAGCSFSTLASLQHLRLSLCHLSNLPAGVFDSLQSVIDLDLSLNNISHIERGLFAHAAKLKTLNLYDLDLSLNNISHIGRGLFAHTAKLKTLNLYGNALTKLGNGTFAGLDSLNFLTLQSNKLRYLPGTFEPEAFFGLDALETLHIHGNQPDFPANFTYPDEALASLTMLRHLIMDGYPRALGPGFASLVHLSHLSFSSGTDEAFCSMHSEIPPEFFAQLITKQKLTINMSFCSFESISPQLFKFLPTIHNLDLSFNEYLLIDGFEKASQGLQNTTLSILNITHIVNSWVQHTEIKNSTFRFLKHTKLNILVVEDNSIINIDPQAVLDLPNTMEYVSFEGNKISSANFLLSSLHLRNLRIAKISRQLRYDTADNNTALTGYQNLNGFRNRNYISTAAKLKGNISHDPKPHTKVLQNTSTLEARYRGDNSTFSFTTENTNVKDFCEDVYLTTRHSQKLLRHTPIPLPLPESLEELYASDIKASYNIPSLQVLNNRVLKYFDYSRNDIKCFGGPSYGVPNLQYVDLSKNGCYKVNPIFFSSMPSLMTLLLYKNRLGNSLHNDLIGQTFSTLYKLETLDLSYNVIDDMSPAAFVNNIDLQILNLSNNEMSVFQPNLANNSKLQKLDLSFNTLSGFSKSSLQQFLYIRKRNSNFTVRIRGNRGWQWKYLYYMSKSRHQLVSMILAARPAADVFITYDQEDRSCRRFMKEVFRHQLHEMEVTTVLGEVDFDARPQALSIAEAVTNTRKTVVVFSKNIFQEYYRQLEVNMAILHELELRRPVVIPVLLLREDRLVRPRGTHAENPQAGPSSGASAQSEGQHDARVARHRGSNRKTSAADDYARFKSLVTNFPLEIATFLKGQTRRCLVYEDSEEFWRLLRASIFEQ